MKIQITLYCPDCQSAKIKENGKKAKCGKQNFLCKDCEFLEIIEDHHAKRSTIIVSQLPVASWFDIIGEAVIADAILMHHFISTKRNTHS